MHMYITNSGLKERESYQKGLMYKEQETDTQILKMLLDNKYSEKLLVEQDESYGNTPLHVACGVHSYVFTKILIEVGSDMSIKNLAGFTPEQVVDDEIEAYKGHLNGPEKDFTLERLSALKGLFPQKI